MTLRPSREVIDLVTLRKRVGGDEDALHEVAHAMRTDLRERMAQLATAGQTLDSRELVLAVALVIRSQHEHEHVHGEAEHVHSHRHDDGPPELRGAEQPAPGEGATVARPLPPEGQGREVVELHEHDRVEVRPAHAAHGEGGHDGQRCNPFFHGVSLGVGLRVQANTPV
jgi:hypothetical protein